MKPWIAMMAAVPLLLAACEEKPYQPPVPHTDKTQPATQMFEPQREALDKARGVQQTVDERAAAQQRQAEQAGK